MKFILDQGLPRSTVEHLADCGIIAEHVGDLRLAAAVDAAILELARQKHAIVVTLDADFHQLLASLRSATPSVVRIRIEGLKGRELAAILVQVVATASAELNAGAVISVSWNHIRVRRLPIGS